jgi:hypothetical protein
LTSNSSRRRLQPSCRAAYSSPRSLQISLKSSSQVEHHQAILIFSPNRRKVD